jgi:23S rRNA (uracil1939-C5)-methyltransferase
VSTIAFNRQSSASRRAPAPTAVTTVEALDASGCGVVHVDGRRMLVDGTLVGERVVLRPRRARRQRHRADLVEVLDASRSRIEPACAHFGVCGGCGLQHMPAQAQLEHKQELLLGALDEHGRVRPDALLEPLTGPSTGYRRRARLGVKHVPGKGGVLVGFRERASPKVAELVTCAILEPRIGGALADLRRVLDALKIRHRVPQLEVALGDAGVGVVLRHLEPLSEHDRALLVDFARERGWQLYVQAGGPQSITPLWPGKPAPLRYALPDFDLELAFLPTDFVQVNASVNRKLVRAAVHHLDVQAHSRVLDLFCGIGNFTLAAARHAASVTGVEGDAALVSRARANAERNSIDNADFIVADLSRIDAGSGWWHGRWDRMLLDPPRTGAGAVLSALDRNLPERIVYVSCNPETLARDAGALVHGKGYRLSHAGVVDMFPHTAHSEAMAVFDRPPGP